jgi:hypothetical protein
LKFTFGMVLKKEKIESVGVTTLSGEFIMRY